MITLKKTITIKYKLAGSIFESINKLAYNTQVRSLGTTKTIVNKLLSNPTLLDEVLPIIIGNNNKNSEWEHEKLDWVSSIQIPISSSGLILDLNSIFDVGNPDRKERIAKYIKDYKVDKDITEENLAQHILKNKEIDPTDYHMYFRYTNARDFLYWLVAINSAQVANKPEDADKSPNIRFFLYDEKIARTRLLANADAQSKAVNKLIALRAKDNGEDILKNIAILQNIIPFEDVMDMSKEDIYLELFSYANNHSSDFLEIAENKELELQATIKKYIELNVLSVNIDNAIVDSSNTEIIVGKTMDGAILYFKNPINKGEVTKFESKYKSLKK
jgi:hypothetical protein